MDHGVHGSTEFDVLPGRSFFGRRAGRPRINLGSNELVHPCLADLHGLADAALDAINAYPVHCDAVRAAAEYSGREPSEVLLAPGSDAAIRALVAVARAAGMQRVVLPEPAYPAWRQAAVLYGMNVESVLMTGEPKRDWMNLIDKVGHESSLVAVTWPNAPMAHGSLFVDDILELQAHCEQASSLLVIDLCYAPFHAEREEIVRISSSCTTVSSASKTFGLASARIAIATGMPDHLGRLAAAGLENAVSQHALNLLLFCIEQASKFEAIWRDIASDRDRIRGILRSAGMDVPTSEGNFIHVVVSDREAQRITEDLGRRGIRVKANTALPWRSSVRFSVVRHQNMDEFLPELMSSWRTHTR